MKKKLALLLALVMIVALAVPVTASAEPADSITLWTYPIGIWGDEATVKALTDAFTAETGIAVTVEYLTYADGDDICLGSTRLPMLRQQRPNAKGQCLSLADFVRPRDKGPADRVGVFAATVDAAMEKEYAHDEYRHLLAQTLADRLAEATVEKMHLEVRRRWWGYAPDEQLTIDQLLREKFQGIRPAVGYPSLPDTSVNFLIDDLVGMKEIGIHLTEHGAMRPHASVSGLMIAHPKAHYFELGPIGDDQLADYARRRGIPLALMRRFLESSMLK